jgi:hypothetical protein
MDKLTKKYESVLEDLMTAKVKEVTAL